MRDGARWAVLLAAVWLGLLLTVAAIATPAGFALLPRPDAGRVAARILAQEAALSLAFGAASALLARHAARRRAETGRGAQASTELLLALGAIFCTVAGYYGVLPLMEQARAGRGALGFGALHAVSSAFFAVKVGLVAALAWRLSRPPSSSC